MDESVVKVNYVIFGLRLADALAKLVGVKSFETHRDFLLKVHV